MMNDAMFFVRTWKKKSARERMCVISLIRNPALQRTNQTGEGKEEALSISHPRPSKPKRGLLPPGPLGLEPALRAQE